MLGKTMKISVDLDCYYQIPLETVFNERKNLKCSSQTYIQIQTHIFHFLVLILSKSLNHSEPRIHL